MNQGKVAQLMQASCVCLELYRLLCFVWLSLPCLVQVDLCHHMTLLPCCFHVCS